MTVKAKLLAQVEQLSEAEAAVAIVVEPLDVALLSRGDWI